MQPRNSFEQQIEEAGRTLRPISARQIRWALDRCFGRYGRRTTKGVITCTECGHAWTDKTARTHCICPACHTRLTIDDNHLRRIYDTADYALFMTVRGGMQGPQTGAFEAVLIEPGFQRRQRAQDAGITLRTSDLLCPYRRKGEIRSFRSRAAVDRPGRAMRHPCKTHNEPAFLQNVELYHLVGTAPP